MARYSLFFVPKVLLNTNQPTLGCVAWLTLTRLCGCCRPASGHTERGVNEKGPAINRGLHQIQNSGFLSSASLCTFSCFLRALPTFPPRCPHTEVEREAWEGRSGVLVRNLRTMRMVYWVNVSESSGADSSGLSSNSCYCCFGVKFLFSFCSCDACNCPGNTCFLNSVMQVLYYTPTFVDNVNNLAKQLRTTITDCNLIRTVAVSAKSSICLLPSRFMDQICDAGQCCSSVCLVISKQEAQLLQTGRAMLCVMQFFC